MARRKHPLNLPAPYRVRRTITATDPLHEGESWEFELEARPDSGTALKVDEVSQDFLSQYLMGDSLWRLSEGKEGTPPAIVIDRGGNEIVVTRMLCNLIATLVVMEQNATEDGVAEWGFEEWSIFSAVAPNAFTFTVEQAEKMRQEAQRGLKKPLGETPEAKVLPGV